MQQSVKNHGAYFAARQKPTSKLPKKGADPSATKVKIGLKQKHAIKLRKKDNIENLDCSEDASDDDDDDKVRF